MSNLVKKDEQIVIYDNRINVSLQGLTKKDYDVFMTCAYKLKDRKNDLIKISYAELMSTANLKHYTIDEIHKYLKESENITAVRVYYEDTEGNIEKAPIFKRFSANKQKRELSLKVNDEFMNLFSELTKSFTTLDLVIYTGLKSKHSKILYQNLCQFRNPKTRSGFWSIPLEDDYSENQPQGFKNIFDISDNFKQKYFVRDIINPAIQELSPFMQITCETLLKGRKAVGYRFDFKEVKRKLIEDKKSNVRTLTEQEKVEYEKMIDGAEQLEMFTELDIDTVNEILNKFEKFKISEVQAIFETMQKENKNQQNLEKVLDLLQKQKNVKNKVGWIRAMLAKEIIEDSKSVSSKSVKKENSFLNFEQRKNDAVYEELEDLLMNQVVNENTAKYSTEKLKNLSNEELYKIDIQNVNEEDFNRIMLERFESL